MAEERKRERTFDEVNEASEGEYYESNQPKLVGANLNMPCKTCKFAGKKYDGTPTRDGKINPKKHPAYSAGSCEKYDVKPSKVYFDAKPCPEYVAK